MQEIEESKIFDESWYRIARQRLSLKASVKVRRQLYRGERWYVLIDPFSNQFFRLAPPAYNFVGRLSMRRTVEEVWRESIQRDPDGAPGQQAVIRLLAQLYHANLLHYALAADSAKLFERYTEQKQRIARSTIMNIMFFRVPLFNPDAMLKRIMPLIRLLVSPVGLLIWVSGVILGAKIGIEHFSELGQQSQGILSTSNIPLLYLSLVIIKTLHEFGHAFAVRRFGGEVNTMGVMFLIFNPLPYMDASSSWAFRSKWRRMFVGAAGMMSEVFVAAIALFIWSRTGPGTIHSLTYNLVFIASVSTVLFNINPLLRFDGYYILSDLLDIPNLHAQATAQIKHLAERYAFGCKRSHSPTTGRTEALLLTVFGLLSGVYKIVVFATILLFVADRFLLVGIIMAGVCAVSWVITPVVRGVKYLASSPQLERTRLRATIVCVGAAVLFLSAFYFVPFPSNFKSPGVIEAVKHNVVVNQIDGNLRSILAPSGSPVLQNEPLMILDNRELELQIAETEATIKEISARRMKALVMSRADIESIDSLLTSIVQRHERQIREKEELTVRADMAGVWVAPRLDELIGGWLRRGTPVGQLIDESEFLFVSVISQKNVSYVFSANTLQAEVRVSGQSDTTLNVDGYLIIPAESTSLPSAALGLAAGGEMAIDMQDSSGMIAAEPFYELRLQISDTSNTTIYQGLSGIVRFELPPEPLIRQWWRKLRQLLQERYQL